MTETISRYTTTISTEKISRLHKKLESIMREFREYKFHFDLFLDDLPPSIKRDLNDLLKTATKNGMGEFKEHLEYSIYSYMNNELCKVLFPEVEKYINLHNEEQVKAHKKKTKQFLVSYANLYVDFCKLMQIHYDAKEFKRALDILSDQQYHVCGRFQNPSEVHVSETDGRKKIVELLNSAIDKLSSELSSEESRISKNKTVSLLHYHFGILKDMT